MIVPAPANDPVAEHVEAAVLSDVAHEVRNQFHKLYYCTELVRSASEGTAGGEGDLRVAAEMLERTVKTLEKLTAGTFDYVRPMSLELVSMRVGDFSAALVGVLRTELDPQARVTVRESIASASVAVDPSRISIALRAIAAGLVARGSEPAEGVLEVELEGGHRDRAETLEVRIAASASERPEEHRRGGLDWAVAVKVLVAHGGGVERADGEAGASRCTLWIPLVGEDGTRRS